MKALLLVGGFGTRLRPLTFSMPKPIVEFCNKPILLFHIEALAECGVTEVILALSRCADKTCFLETELKKHALKLNVELIFSYEDIPLGTGGPLALASKYLTDTDEPFFVANSDIICAYPYKDMLKFFRVCGGEGLIATTRVQEPSKYGVLVTDPKTCLINSFIEKPQEFVSNQINSGLYLLSPDVLKRIPLENHSLEKQTFPAMARDKKLFYMDLKGFWMDIGQPRDYVKGSALYLNWLRENNSERLASGEGIIGNVLLHATATIGPNCKIGPNVVIGANVVVSQGCSISNSTLLSNSYVGDFSWVHSSILGWHSSVGKWVRLENISVLGEDVTIKDELYVNGAKILPHKSISESILEPQIVM